MFNLARNAHDGAFPIRQRKGLICSNLHDSLKAHSEPVNLGVEWLLDLKFLSTVRQVF